MQLDDVEGVDVAADYHRIALARKGLQQPLARNGVAVPAVGPGAPPGAGELVELRHARLLRDDVPARARRFERGSEPLLLRRAEHGAPRIGELGTLCRIDRVRAAAARARADFVRPILAVVEHEEVGEIAMPGTHVDARAWPE